MRTMGAGQVCKVMGPTAPSGKGTTSTLGASSKSGSWEREGFKVEDCGEMSNTSYAHTTWDGVIMLLKSVTSH